MKTATKDGVTSVVAQNEVVIPDLTIKDLLSAIPLVASLFSNVAPSLTLLLFVAVLIQNTLLSAVGIPLWALRVSSSTALRT